MIPGDLLSAFPHRQFHTLPGLLDSRAALPNSYPNALRAMQGGSLHHFMMVFGMTRPGDELTTYCVRGGHATDWANPTRCKLEQRSDAYYNDYSGTPFERPPWREANPSGKATGQCKFKHKCIDFYPWREANLSWKATFLVQKGWPHKRGSTVLYCLVWLFLFQLADVFDIAHSSE